MALASMEKMGKRDREIDRVKINGNSKDAVKSWVGIKIVIGLLFLLEGRIIKDWWWWWWWWWERRLGGFWVWFGLGNLEN